AWSCPLSTRSLAMTRSLTGTVFGLLIVATTLLAQEGIQRGKIKKIDLDKRMLTLTVAGKEQSFTLTENTRIAGAQGKDLKDRLQGFKEGTEADFKAVTQDGRAILLGLRRADGGGKEARQQPRVDTSKLKPLTELGTGDYQGHKGGLYLDGKNERPAAHEAAGLALAKQVQPLTADGKPNADGKIVLLSVGMSNTSQASQGFQKVLASGGDVNPR